MVKGDGVTMEVITILVVEVAVAMVADLTILMVAVSSTVNNVGHEEHGLRMVSSPSTYKWAISTRHSGKPQCIVSFSNPIWHWPKQ